MGATMTARKQPASVGERVKRLRKRAGMTQQELAGKAGISLSNLAQIEQGQKTDPRISTVTALAEALGVDVNQLLFNRK
jgi:transcriptional regulator with XRE-family HTH domain